MKCWSTFGAFGDKVVELNWREVWSLLRGSDVELSGTSVVICWGKSSKKSLFQAPSRERQLGE